MFMDILNIQDESSVNTSSSRTYNRMCHILCVYILCHILCVHIQDVSYSSYSLSYSSYSLCHILCVHIQDVSYSSYSLSEDVIHLQDVASVTCADGLCVNTSSSRTYTGCVIFYVYRRFTYSGCDVCKRFPITYICRMCHVYRFNTYTGCVMCIDSIHIQDVASVTCADGLCVNTSSSRTYTGCVIFYVYRRFTYTGCVNSTCADVLCVNTFSSRVAHVDMRKNHSYKCESIWMRTHSKHIHMNVSKPFHVNVQNTFIWMRTHTKLIHMNVSKHIHMNVQNTFIWMWKTHSYECEHIQNIFIWMCQKTFIWTWKTHSYECACHLTHTCALMRCGGCA